MGEEEWNIYLQSAEEKQWYMDYSDIMVTIKTVTEEGIWTHEHVNPMYLEYDREMVTLRMEQQDSQETVKTCDYNRFGEMMPDGRLTAPFVGKLYDIRAAILYAKRLGRPLTEKEIKCFEIKVERNVG